MGVDPLPKLSVAAGEGVSLPNLEGVERVEEDGERSVPMGVRVR